MRKNWKKVVSLLLAASMALSMNVATYAEEIADVVEEVVVEEAAEVAATTSDNTTSDNTASNNTVSQSKTVSSATIKAGKYTITITYNQELPFVAKKLNVLDLEAKATVSGEGISADAVIKGSFAKDDVAKGKKAGDTTFTVKKVSASGKAEKAVKTALKDATKALKDNKEAALKVKVNAFDLSNEDVVEVATADMKGKSLKAKFTATSKEAYGINIKVNTKDAQKSKVTLIYVQKKTTKKGVKAVVKKAKVNLKKHNVKLTTSGNNIVLSGDVNATLSAK